MGNETLGQLQNSFREAEKVGTLLKDFESRVKVINLPHEVINRDTDGYFRTNYSITNGTDVTLDDIDNLDIVSHLYINDSNTFKRVWTYGELTGGTWTFNYTTGSITTDTISALSDVFVNDGNNYTTVTTTTFNPATDWETDNSLVIVLDDNTEVSIGWNDTKTFTSSANLRFKITGDGSTYDMFDSRGRPIRTEFKYS